MSGPLTPDQIAALAGDPIIWTALWVIAAGALSALPSRRHHWPLAYLLIALGAPILVWAWMEGPLRGLAASLAAALVLRWPLRRLAGWIAARTAR